jgi:hypothetical protein
MKRTTSLAYFGWIVLLSHAVLGCVSEYTAPDGVLDPNDVSGHLVGDFATADSRPVRAHITVPARDDVLARWELPSTSPWLPYEKLTLPSVLADQPTPLWMPEIEQLDQVRLARSAAMRVAQDGLPRGTAWFVDLSGAASIAFASTLAQYASEPIAAIPTFNNWPAENELVPAEETLTAMITAPPRLPGPDDVGARPVFLLDSWRLAFKDELIDEGVIDNRYMLTAADFPTAAVLRGQGLTQIIYLVSGELDEEDDLHDLFAEYEAAGIAIYLVDLDDLVRDRDDRDVTWYVQARSRFFHVRTRRTVIHDPLFYRRARGGFGGVHLVPVPSGHMHLWAHGGG